MAHCTVYGGGRVRKDRESLFPPPPASAACDVRECAVCVSTAHAHQGALDDCLRDCVVCVFLVVREQVLMERSFVFPTSRDSI